VADSGDSPGWPENLSNADPGQGFAIGARIEALDVDNRAPGAEPIRVEQSSILFSAIMDKLRGHPPSSTGQTPSGAPQHQSRVDPSKAPAPAQPSAPIQNVDVDAGLAEMAKKKGGGGNYRTSIVDLLKLLDLDSSLNARKELATELNVKAGEHGSAEQNIALQKAVMRKLAENGGKVPDSLRN
jgi:uncharacterized protein DUF3597